MLHAARRVLHVASRCRSVAGAATAAAARVVLQCLASAAANAADAADAAAAWPLISLGDESQDARTREASSSELYRIQRNEASPPLYTPPARAACHPSSCPPLPPLSLYFGR